jgi:hypothetical protein
MVDFIIAIAFILALLAGWFYIQQLARRFAARHPELGPAREEGSGCGNSCMCVGGSCSKRTQHTNLRSDNDDFSINEQKDQMP